MPRSVALDVLKVAKFLTHCRALPRTTCGRRPGDAGKLHVRNAADARILESCCRASEVWDTFPVVTEEGGDSQREEFSEFTLRGARFDGGRLPVDALVELGRYRALLLEAASRAWAQDHQDAPLPEDFDAEFDLAIVEVRDGSATSLLERPESAYGEYFDRGRDEIERLFQEVVAGLATPLFEEPPMDAFEAPREDSEADEASKVPASSELDSGTDGSSAQEGEQSESVEEQPEGFIEVEPPRSSTFTREGIISYASLPAFREIGSSLQAGESAEIVTPSGERVEIDSAARVDRIRPLVERIDQIVVPPPPLKREYRKNSIAGRLVSLDPENRSFRVKTLLHGELSGRYKDDALFDDLKAVLNSSAQAPVVRIAGRMSWAGETLKRILEAQRIELLEIAGEAWSRNIIELASLPRLWDEESGGGEEISFTALEAARELLRAAQPEQDSAPGIFPIESGGVLLEWTVPTRVTSVEISPDETPEFVVHTFALEPRRSTELTTTNLAEATTALLEALG